MAWWWSYLLTAVGVTGLVLSGSKRTVGWAIGLGAQVLWLAYALATSQYGFLLSAFAYGTVYARNWWRWRNEERQQQLQLPPRSGTWAEPGVYRGGFRVDGPPPVAGSAHLGEPWPRRSTTGREPAGAAVPPPQTRAFPPLPPPHPDQPYRVPGTPRPAQLLWPEDDTDPPTPYDQDREN